MKIIYSFLIFPTVQYLPEFCSFAILQHQSYFEAILCLWFLELDKTDCQKSMPVIPKPTLGVDSKNLPKWSRKETPEQKFVKQTNKIQRLVIVNWLDRVQL